MIPIPLLYDVVVHVVVEVEMVVEACCWPIKREGGDSAQKGGSSSKKGSDLSEHCERSGDEEFLASLSAFFARLIASHSTMV